MDLIIENRHKITQKNVRTPENDKCESFKKLKNDKTKTKKHTTKLI